MHLRSERIYGCDPANNLTSVVDEAGATVQYTFDDASQFRSVIQSNHPDPSHNTFSYGYDNDGNLITLTDANSHTTQNVFDLLNQLTTETLPASGPSQLRSYDAAGNRLSLKDFNRTKRDNRVREKIVVEKRGIGFHRANGRRTGKENGLRTLVPHGGSK